MKSALRVPSLLMVMTSTVIPVKAATDTFNVTASSSLNYTINGINDPALTLVRGFTYSFNISVASIHPFYIKTVAGTGSGNQYTNGVSAQGVSSGTIIFEVPGDAPETLYYQCGNHSGMTGPLNIVDPPIIHITDISAGSNVVIRSTGVADDALGLNVLVKTSLTNSVWADAGIQTNSYAEGTNTTLVVLPPGGSAFFLVEQGFF